MNRGFGGKVGIASLDFNYTYGWLVKSCKVGLIEEDMAILVCDSNPSRHT